MINQCPICKGEELPGRIDELEEELRKVRHDYNKLTVRFALAQSTLKQIAEDDVRDPRELARKTIAHRVVWWWCRCGQANLSTAGNCWFCDGNRQDCEKFPESA